MMKYDLEALRATLDEIPTRIEIYRRRMAKEQAEFEFRPQLPVKGGEPACPRYNGMWLIVDDSRKNNEDRRVAQIPLGCGRNVCSVCGEVKRRQVYAELCAGYKRVIAENPDMEMDLLTLTFRTKPSDQTWKQWIARREFTDEELATMSAEILAYEDSSPYQMYKLISTYCLKGQKYGVLARHYMSPRQWSRYIAFCMKTFWKYWKPEYGESYYTRITELTKQGNPHIHLAMVVPKELHNEAMQTWIMKTWHRITLDSYQVMLSRIEKPYFSKDDAMIAGYIAKYISKDWESSADWSGVRRTAKSLAFKKPVITSIDAAEYVEPRTGEILPFNKPEYRAAYGSMYHYKQKIEARRHPWISGKELRVWTKWRTLWHQMNQRYLKYTLINRTVQEMKGKTFDWFEEKYRHSGNLCLAVWRDGYRKVIV